MNNPKVKKPISSKIATKSIRHLRMHLTKRTKNLYSENYQTLLK